MSDQFYRKLQILQWIPRYPGRITVDQLEQKMLDYGVEVSLRTLQRDIETLSVLFTGLISQRYRDHSVGWYWSVDAPLLTLTGMTIHQALSFSLIKKFLSPLFPSTTLNELQPFFEQAEALLNNLNDNPLRKWPNKIAVVHPPHPRTLPTVQPAVHQAVSEALITEHQLQIIFKRTGTLNKSYLLNALGLLLRGSIQYLIATKVETGEIRLFPLHQILEATVEKAPIDGPADYDLNALIDDNAMDYDWIEGGSAPRIRLKLRINRRLADHLILMPLTPHQLIEDYDASHKLLTANLYVTDSLRTWLIQHADRAEIIHPQKLRNEIIKKIQNMANHYGINR
ncbi:WYL domain-containing protein [Methylicorpusculum oleiharenae]|uniref:helix-turn-helix transcriptional regulator n=1 Tax=Methylicorpusculum oleiharenae TaxID=1338687 RepID=UPI0013599358|nr:WYL domain-containing protein [Methylicorpusculum oleiharenae]MCD2450206.1 WYL domain-containing protein [Methylicorpusculum oleiharenae]